MANRVIVYGLARRPRLVAKVKKIAETILRHFRVRSKILEVIFLNDKKMVSLKRRHLRASGPANTLSLASGEGFPQPKRLSVSLGEIFINTDLTHYELAEISPLLIHSTLHILGYHHDDERDKIEMDRLALKAFRALGH